MLYCEAELCLAASTFARGGILSENFKDGKVTVHSAKNTTKFGAIVGRSTKQKPQQFGLPRPERWSSQLDWNALENLKSTQRHRSLQTLIRQDLQEEDLQEEFCLKRCSSQPTKEKPQ